MMISYLDISYIYMSYFFSTNYNIFILPPFPLDNFISLYYVRKSLFSDQLISPLRHDCKSIASTTYNEYIAAVESAKATTEQFATLTTRNA